MSRLQLLELGRQQCAALKSQYPGVQAIESVGIQIEYLIGLESGALSDRSRLKDIIIGVLTAREIEPLDIKASETFYKIASEAKLM